MQWKLLKLRCGSADKTSLVPSDNALYKKNKKLFSTPLDFPLLTETSFPTGLKKQLKVILERKDNSDLVMVDSSSEGNKDAKVSDTNLFIEFEVMESQSTTDLFKSHIKDKFIPVTKTQQYSHQTLDDKQKRYYL